MVLRVLPRVHRGRSSYPQPLCLLRHRTTLQLRRHHNANMKNRRLQSHTVIVQAMSDNSTMIDYAVHGNWQPRSTKT